MSRTTRVLTLGTTALALAGCADLFGSGDNNTLTVGSAFQTVPVGFSATSSSFDPSGDQGPFFPGEMRRGSGGVSGSDRDMGHGGGMMRAEGEHRDGFGGPALRGFLMGGGMGPDFLGVIPFGRLKGPGPFRFFHLSDACTFDDDTGRVTCPDKTHDGLTISTSFAFKDTAGVAQPKFDTASTDFVNVKVSVTGTRVRRDSSTSTVSHQSDRSVSGLAPGSTERTVNGRASGSETTTGVRDSVPFTAVRTVSDTTSGLVIPIADGHPTIPSAGVVIRNMRVTITPEGGTATTRSRREKVTFDGTNVVKIEITRDGETKTCTMTLPSRKLVCE